MSDITNDNMDEHLNNFRTYITVQYLKQQLREKYPDVSDNITPLLRKKTQKMWYVIDLSTNITYVYDSKVKGWSISKFDFLC